MAPTLELDFVLNDQVLALVVDLLREFGGDGVVGSWIFHHETFVALDPFQNRGLFHGPFADVCPFLGRFGIFLLGRGSLPPRLPAVRELLVEGSCDLGRL